jgi:hypothetical protein
VIQPSDPAYAVGRRRVLDDFFQSCGSVFIQRVDAVAKVSIFSTPVSITNGAKVAARSTGPGTLTFAISSDELGLSELIVPGFDLIFTGIGVPGTGGAADAIVWTAAARAPTGGRVLNFRLANGNSLAFEVERVTGSVTTTLSEITPPAFVDDASGHPGKGAFLLEGPADSDSLEIVTSYGPVSVSVNRIQLVAVAQLQQAAPAKPVAAAVAPRAPSAPVEQVPMFTIKLKPCPQGATGDFRIEGMAVPFNMKLVGGEEAWSCRVQLEGTPGLVNLTLIVTSDEAAKP